MPEAWEKHFECRPFWVPKPITVEERKARAARDAQMIPPVPGAPCDGVDDNCFVEMEKSYANEPSDGRYHPSGGWPTPSRRARLEDHGRY